MIIWFFVVIGLYFFYQPWKLNPQKRSSRVRINAILFVLLFIANILIPYFTFFKEPEIITNAVEVFDTKYQLFSQIGGGYQSYSYSPDSLPNESARFAKFKMQFSGFQGTIYLECVMIKDNKGKWRLKSYKQDSLVQKKQSGVSN